MNRMSIMNLTE